MTVITRFAPSPTGYLHIGSVRTAYFNWLYAKHHGGTFLLRIEDTDKERSTKAAIDVILKDMTWIGLDWEGEPYYQSQHAARHQQVAHKLLEEGKAYRCYCTSEELEQMREKARAEKRSPGYDGRCRNLNPANFPPHQPFVVRLKSPESGSSIIEDLVQGPVEVRHEQLDDMILLRSDGSPTYMLSVVVDDHDMNITHVIRGDDHLTNAFRQKLLYDALGWKTPAFAHIPLIHGQDGKKLSKRHGALGADAYREEGFLPEALLNYLLKLGWAHGDDEIISKEQAIDWFDCKGIGQSSARFDLAKLTALNGHYMRATPDQALLDHLMPFLEKMINASLDVDQKEILLRGMAGLKQRAKTLIELADNANIYLQRRPLSYDEKAQQLLSPENKAVIKDFCTALACEANWTEENLENFARTFAEENNLKLGKLAQPLRAALTGRTISPSVFDMMIVFGKSETLARLEEAALS